jgi:putative transposase
MNKPHRRRNKSYNIPGDAHELTFSCYRRLKLLARDRSRQWLIDALDVARRRQRLSLWAYVIMPEHVHVLLWPQEPEYRMSAIRSAIKIPVQRAALSYLRRHTPQLLERLCDRQPNGDVHYRFWQRGGGYDRNVHEPKTLRKMIEYIHDNPVRRGLVKEAVDWPWSSARYYAGWDDVNLSMDPLVDFVGF